MYAPDAFKVEDVDVLHDMMREIGAACWIGHGPDGLVATHVPVELQSEPKPWGALRCHFARSNPHAELLRQGGEQLVIFQGPVGYVSPSWYATKKETSKVVPTLNYVAVHVYGRSATFEGTDALRPHLAALTDHFESDFDLPWKIDDAPAEFIDVMCREIVGVKIEITRIEGKWKLSQNRPEADRAGVIRGLVERGGDSNRRLADLAERAR